MMNEFEKQSAAVAVAVAVAGSTCGFHKFDCTKLVTGNM